MTSDDLLRDGREMLAKVTPGPWSAKQHVTSGFSEFMSGSYVVGVYDVPVAVTGDWPVAECGSDGLEDADAAFIAWARNNLTALLDELERQQKALDRIARYGGSDRIPSEIAAGALAAPGAA